MSTVHDGHGGATVAVVDRVRWWGLGLARLRPNLGRAWVWSGLWLVYLWHPLTRGWHHGGPQRWITVVAILAYATIFLYSFVSSRRRFQAGIFPGRRLGPVLVGTALLLVVTVSWMLGQDALGLFVYVGVMAVFLLPRRLGIGVVAAILLGTAAAQLTIPGWTPDASIQFQIFMAALTMYGVLHIIRRNVELAAAREEITRLAIDEERNRFARDLHDILGHSLTVVAIKAELAGRLVRLDPARAEAEIADVEQLSRQALAEVRTAVAGYREVTLSGELVNARTALAAAGIDADLPTAIDEIPDDHRELFAWVVREGVTNVVRHSGASRCLVRIGPSTVEISDDGPRPRKASGPGPLRSARLGAGALDPRLGSLGPGLNALGPGPDAPGPGLGAGRLGAGRLDADPVGAGRLDADPVGAGRSPELAGRTTLHNGSTQGPDPHAAHARGPVGPGPAGHASGSRGSGGHGLVGLRERAEAAGGTLSVAACADGGFRLTVRV